MELGGDKDARMSLFPETGDGENAIVPKGLLVDMIHLLLMYRQVAIHEVTGKHRPSGPSENGEANNSSESPSEESEESSKLALLRDLTTQTQRALLHEMAADQGKDASEPGSGWLAREMFKQMLKADLYSIKTVTDMVEPPLSDDLMRMQGSRVAMRGFRLNASAIDEDAEITKTIKEGFPVCEDGMMRLPRRSFATRSSAEGSAAATGVDVD